MPRRCRRGPRPAWPHSRPRGQQLLGDLPQPFATEDVCGLHPQGVERPEAAFDQAQERSPAEPGDADQHRQKQDRRNPRQDVQDLGRSGRQPQRRDQRRHAEDHAGQPDQENPCQHQFRQAHLRQQAAGQGEQRTPLGARRVVLDIAFARVDDRLHRGHRLAGETRPRSAVAGSAPSATRAENDT